MFDFSLGELLLIVVVAVVFIGPKELPVVIRKVSQAMLKIKRFTAEIRKVFDEISEESGIKPHMQMIRGDDGKWYEAYPSALPADDSEGKKKPAPPLPVSSDV